MKSGMSAAFFAAPVALFGAAAFFGVLSFAASGFVVLAASVLARAS
jgi:hypothetical protein